MKGKQHKKQKMKRKNNIRNIRIGEDLHGRILDSPVAKKKKNT